MRYTLKDYQTDAVRDVLSRLDRARDGYHRYGARSQFALAATTGAGKTVMAAAVIEALFFGSDEFDFPADPGATVLWFSDDPSLNDQSMARIHSASSELGPRLRRVENTFAEETFAPGTVYFLNAQKLREGARLVRGASPAGNTQTPVLAAPDMAQRNIYDVIRNTLGAEGRTLYLVLDEAHRGMKATRDRETIVQRLINGGPDAPPMPVVFGISATVDRFVQAMARAQHRDALPPVQVDPALVQASGLLKDDIVLVIPAEAGTYDTTLLRDAVRRIKESTAAWAAYARQQEEADPVAPLLVVQVTDKPTDEELVRILDVIAEEWPELPPQAVAHVFGTHRDRELPGQRAISYIAPQRVQETRSVRVLLAMEAISTGWDCPRAEVLISFRTRRDATYVHQLLGRMMRTPLARRIPGNEVLNSVDCLLPHFDRTTSTEIATMLMRGATDPADPSLVDPVPGTDRRVLFDPVTLTPNTEIAEEVWAAFDALPAVSIPRGRAKPVKRLDRLAFNLSRDRLRPGAQAEALTALCAVLDGRRVQYADKVSAARADVLTLSAEQVRARAGAEGSPQLTSKALELTADPRAIHESYTDAARKLSEWLAAGYVQHVVPLDEEDMDLLEGETLVAALGTVPEIVADVEHEADKLARYWLHESRVARKGLTDERQAEYDRIEGMAVTPEDVSLTRPKVAQADRRWREHDGSEHLFPTRRLHLVADKEGNVPVDLNDWELRVLDREASQPSFRAWYRNPSRATKESVAVAYKDGTGEWRALRPDFVFFHERQDGTVAADLVDPHGHHLSDALPKLRGLADFAEHHGHGLRRVESVAETDGELKVLDLTRAAVRDAVRAATDAKALYRDAPAY